MGGGGVAVKVAVVGGGPAGLRAAEMAVEAGAEVSLFEAKPSVGRKFLVAGKGGLNLTHEEPVGMFAERYSGENQPVGLWQRLLQDCSVADVRQWAHSLGAETFVATSGRVYPRELKSAGLLRAWVQRLRNSGVQFHVREQLVWLERTANGGLRLEFAGGEGWTEADSVVLALGGGSWPDTGSNGNWVKLMRDLGVNVRDLQPANCGWEVAWPEQGLAEVEGKPLKNVAAEAGGERAAGELLITHYGLEGGVIYRLGRCLRQMEPPVLTIDFKPDVAAEQLARKLHGVQRDFWLLARQRWKLSAGEQWILSHFADVEHCASATELAARVKNCEVPLKGPRPLAEAISTAGGVCWSELNDDLMLRRVPGVFLAGEMIDWEAPTGGYLLQGAFATGTCAGRAAARWSQPPAPSAFSRAASRSRSPAISSQS